MLYPTELRARRGRLVARIARRRNRLHSIGLGEKGDQAAPAAHGGAAISQAGRLRYFDFVMAAFVAILLLSNVIGAGKVAQMWLRLRPSFGAGILFFPLSYVIGDVLTEVYGYARARRVHLGGFVAVLFMAFMSWVVVALPPAAGWRQPGGV